MTVFKSIKNIHLTYLAFFSCTIDLLSSNVWQISPNMFNDNMKTNKILIKL